MFHCKYVTFDVSSRNRPHMIVHIALCVTIHGFSYSVHSYFCHFGHWIHVTYGINRSVIWTIQTLTQHSVYCWRFSWVKSANMSTVSFSVCNGRAFLRYINCKLVINGNENDIYTHWIYRSTKTIAQSHIHTHTPPSLHPKRSCSNSKGESERQRDAVCL